MQDQIILESSASHPTGVQHYPLIQRPQYQVKDKDPSSSKKDETDCTFVGGGGERTADTNARLGASEPQGGGHWGGHQGH